ncbi:MAG: hypothetical protein JKY43_00870 [Phycisphaerales bacterium]|nr:hypothetical protein [Phycisphaerales bacterium]
MASHIRTALNALILGSLLLFGAGSTAIAAPEPSPVATTWEFTFDRGPLRLAWVETEQGNKPYFFLTYNITNFSGDDLLFAPDVSLMTDNITVIKSGRNVPTAVTNAILEELDNPLIESQIDIVSTVLQGPEHARDGVLIWPAEQLDVDEVSIFFAGLSGEFESYVVGRETDNPRRYTLRKTLMLRFATPGNFGEQGARPFELAEKRWVMR